MSKGMRIRSATLAGLLVAAAVAWAHETACADITTLAAIEPIGQNSVTLQWSTPICTDHPSGLNFPLSYIGYYSETNPAGVGMPLWISSATSMDLLPTPNAYPDTETYLLPGLKPGRTYYFAMIGVDWSGIQSHPVNPASATTDPDPTPPGTPTGLYALALASGAVQVGWTASGDDGATGTASSYLLKYSTDPDVDGPTWWSLATPATGLPDPAISGTVQSTQVGGLAALTTYYFRLQALDDADSPSGLTAAAQATTSAAPDDDESGGAGCGALGGLELGAFLLLAAARLLQRPAR